MPPLIESLMSAIADTARLVMSPGIATLLFGCEVAVPLIMAPGTAAGSVVNQLNHPKSGEFEGRASPSFLFFSSPSLARGGGHRGRVVKYRGGEVEW